MINYLEGFLILNELLSNQKKKREEIINIQNKKLRNIISYIYKNNKYYHDLFLDNNIKPEDIKNINDINKIPKINKQQIRENEFNIISSNYDVNKLHKMKTSGSTGNPLIVYINSNEDLIRKAKHIRSNKNLGQRIRDNWVTITGPHHFPQKTTTIQDLLNIYNPRPVSVFLDIESQISSIAKLKPVILEGYATSLYLLASYLEKKNSDIIKPRFIVSSAELLTDSDREKIESVFNVPVYDQYSCIEFGRVSWECEHRTGYHIDSDNLVVQFIDESGEEVGVGETGEIVCTSLFNYSMPLIRYSIGDYGSLSDEPCNCGITLPLMKHIEGRHDSIIVFPDGRKVSPRALSISMSMFKDYSNIQQFQIIQKKVDSIKVSLKLKQTINNNFCSDLTAHLYNVLSLDKEQINIDVELVENIPLSKTGKLFYIKSEVDSE